MATVRHWDADFEKRVHRHQVDRGDEWETMEEEKRLSLLPFAGRPVLLDCITLWLTNIFHDNRYNLDVALEEAKSEWDRFIQQEFRLIVVSNEIGICRPRFDDAANFIPARVTALWMVLVPPSARGFRFIVRCACKHASPNAGYPESALADILDYRFGRPNNTMASSWIKR